MPGELMSKTFDHFTEGYLVKVWRDDLETDDYIIFEPVIDAYAKPDSMACNPTDYNGYLDTHLEVYEKTEGWSDSDTQEALEYADDIPNYLEILEARYD